ncbi:hypothetical protein [Devosia sp. 1635]|uniref:hypothetical protein n=1 Tax=Devosia sp. 1635 TaxID=2726066 RepID=UPI0015663535|nr:hypothetical protein [Devosia sp. 1635]
MAKILRITPALAERHEALWLRLTALQEQARSVAAKKPEALLGDEVRMAAEAVLHDAQIFGPKRRAQEKLPPAAPSWGGLSVQLGQALALLAAYEASHTGWSEEDRFRVWLTRPLPMPVRRLLPAEQFSPEGRDEMRSIRQKLALRMDRAFRDHFSRGYQAGIAAARRAEPLGEAVPPARLDPGFPAIRQL